MSLQVMGHKGGWVNQLAAKNMQKGMTEVQKCQKAAWHMIWLESSHPMACCHVS
jgi:hypothetical protein